MHRYKTTTGHIASAAARVHTPDGYKTPQPRHIDRVMQLHYHYPRQ